MAQTAVSCDGSCIFDFVFQEQAKDTLKRLVNEKLDAVKKLQDVEKTLSTTEDEFATLRELYDKNSDENKTLAGMNHKNEYRKENKMIKEYLIKG